MYFDGNITFKGITSGSLGVIVSSMPKMQHSTVKATEYDIPLRDGIQYSAWRNRTDAQITVKFAIVKDNNTNYIQTLRATRQWLEGTGVLILDNNPDVYYNVKKVEITDEEMFTLSSGELEATFVIEPFEYTVEDIEIDKHVSGEMTVTVTNDGDLCKPIIVTSPYYGASPTVGSWGISIQIDDNEPAIIKYSTIWETRDLEVTCDTNKMYTYATNEGVVEAFEEHFTTHNYEDLWIPHGTHDITLNRVEGSTNNAVNIKLRRGFVI